jgi:hypothetical protein
VTATILLQFQSGNQGELRIRAQEACTSIALTEFLPIKVTISFGRPVVVFRQSQQKFEDFFLGNAGEISFAKSRGETIEDELTGLDGIFFQLDLWHCRWKSTAREAFMMHLLWLGLLAEIAMYEEYAMRGSD